MISPTSYGIRYIDQYGSGEFGASRGKRKHNGVDFICNPGENIFFPFDSGMIIRIANPYANDPRYSGVYIEATDNNCYYTCKIFYMEPWYGKINRVVDIYKGEVIGVAQNISERYPGIINHVHLQVSNAYYANRWFNPKDILEVPNGH